MRAIITQGRLRGSIRAVSSKSQAQRLLICAALADTPTTLHCPDVSEDIAAAVRCMQALGAEITRTGEFFSVVPIRTAPSQAELDVGESGAVLRFLLPVVCAMGVQTRFVLRGSLPGRPLEPLWTELCAHGAILQRPCPDEIYAAGRLTGRDFALTGDVSSQFLSGLMLALPKLGGGCIRLLSPVVSGGYLEMTRRAMAYFGVKTTHSAEQLTVGSADYRSPGPLSVEGDWSAAAVFLCAQEIYGGVRCTGLDLTSAQPDRAVTVLAAQIRRGMQIDLGETPDLLPPLAVVAAAVPGETVFYHAARLRTKESDRLQSVCHMLQNLGASAQVLPDGLRVTGGTPLHGGTVHSCGDHRIAMSAALAAGLCDGEVTVCGAQAVQKSYPAFWQDYRALGGVIRWEEEV